MQAYADASPVHARFAALQAVADRAGAAGVVQRVGERLEVVSGSGHLAPAWTDPAKTTVIIEVMVQMPEKEGAAKAMIDAIEATRATGPMNIAIALAPNRKGTTAPIKGRATGDARSLLDYATAKHVPCAVVPMVWSMPETTEQGGYVFPFFEARSSLGRATQTAALKSNASGRVFHRTMDVDVTNDPLLKPGTATGANQNTVKGILDDADTGSIVSGGYDWDTANLSPVRAAFISKLNSAEHTLREAMAKPTEYPEWDEARKDEKGYQKEYDKGVARATGKNEFRNRNQGAVYAPEPNIYIPAEQKENWDKGVASGLKERSYGHDRQMSESAFGRKGTKAPLVYRGDIATTKPRKGHLDNLGPMFDAVERLDATGAEAAFKTVIKDIHQSYLGKKARDKAATMNGAQISVDDNSLIEKALGPVRDELWKILSDHIDSARSGERDTSATGGSD